MKIAIITGASRGIGKSTTRVLGARGVGVIATYNKSAGHAEALVSEIERAGGSAVALPLDVANSASFEAFGARVLRVLGEKWQRDTFDYLVNNAGVGGFTPIESVTEAWFDELSQVHLRGPFFLTQRLLPLIARGGQIVNVTSATTRVATTGVAPYAALKAAMDVLTRYMAKEFGERDIRANSISPGAIRTDLGGGIDNHPEVEKLLASQTALGRIGEPEDVARAIAALLSDDCAWINAQRLEVGGGYMV